jgi:hypothetical protein
MEGYQMFTIFVPKKVSPEKKKAAPKVEKAEAGAAPEKKERSERAKVEKPATEPRDEDEIF